MIAGIRAEIPVNATPEAYAGWVAAGRGRDRQLRNSGRSRARGWAVIRTGLAIRGPRSVGAQVWLIDPAAGPGAVLVGRLRLLSAPWSLTSTLCFEGSASTTVHGLRPSRSAARAAAQRMADRLLSSVAADIALPAELAEDQLSA